jgi:hypothetical protein
MSSLCHLADDGSNERARVPPRESGGSELLLGMHGFVGGQSQNSGRAPGLQLGPAKLQHCMACGIRSGRWWDMVDGGPSRGWIRIA